MKVLLETLAYVKMLEHLFIPPNITRKKTREVDIHGEDFSSTLYCPGLYSYELGCFIPQLMSRAFEFIIVNICF